MNIISIEKINHSHFQRDDVNHVFQKRENHCKKFQKKYKIQSYTLVGILIGFEKRKIHIKESIQFSK